MGRWDGMASVVRREVQTKKSWTKTTHCIRGYNLEVIHAQTSLCGYGVGLTLGLPKGLSFWWLNNKSVQDSQKNNIQSYCDQEVAGSTLTDSAVGPGQAAGAHFASVTRQYSIAFAEKWCSSAGKQSTRLVLYWRRVKTFLGGSKDCETEMSTPLTVLSFTITPQGQRKTYLYVDKYTYTDQRAE